MERGRGSRDGPYRDGVAWVRARYLEKRAGVEELEARLTGTFWEVLPRTKVKRLLALKAAASAADDSINEVIRAEPCVDAYERALRAAIELIPTIEDEQRRLPSYAPALVPGRYAGRLPARALADITRFGQKLKAILEKHDRDVSVEPASAVGFCATFTADGCPFTLLAELQIERDIVGEPPAWGEAASVTAATSVASGFTSLRLTPEMWSDSVLKALRFKRDVEIGDANFDGLFLIDADVEPARTMLTPAVRSALVKLSRFDVPTLTVGSGEAVVRYTYELSAEPIAAAIRGLVGIRRTSPIVKLMLGDDDSSV